MSFSGLIGKKRGMTQVFEEDGSATPVTVIEVFPLTVTQVKTQSVDGYDAVQVGYISGKEKHLSKAQQGHLKKSNIPLLRRLKEFRVSSPSELKTGDVLNPFEQEFLKEGIHLNVTGRSIGKGFQGGTKRWGFGRGPMTHGSKSHRLPGSIGAGTTPGRVYKGTKMAGQMGNRTVTMKKLRVVKLLPEKNVILLKGNVPGVEEGLLILRQNEQN